MKNQKIQKVFTDHGFGFPVKLINVPMIKIRGIWTPNIDYNDLAEVVLKALCIKSSRMTGHEVRFIRLQFGMTLQKFAKRFAVSHAAVMKWEKSGAQSTSMHWTTEKDLRLFVFSKLQAKPKAIANLYQELELVRVSKSQTLKVDLENLAA